MIEIVYQDQILLWIEYAWLGSYWIEEGFLAPCNLKIARSTLFVTTRFLREVADSTTTLKTKGSSQLLTVMRLY